MEKKAKRDIGVELARLIGCLIVIGVHIKLSDNVSGDYNTFRLILSCLLADGVAIFWMISGCFLFRTKSYAKLLSRTVKTIVVPLLILSAVLLLFADFLFNGASISESLPSASKVFSTVSGMLTLHPTVSGSGHLWYCYAYILLMLMFPVLKAFALWLDEDIKREKIFIIVSLALILFNDLTKNAALSFSHHAFNAVVPAAILVLWGHIIYKNKENLLRLKNRKIPAFVYAVVFILINILRATIVLFTRNRSLLYWYTVFGFITAVLIILFCLEIGKKIKENSFSEKIVATLGGHTFLIYLLHIPLRNFLYRFDLKGIINSFLLSFSSGIVYDILYTVIMTVVIFGLTLVLSFVLKSIPAICRKIFLKSK